MNTDELRAKATLLRKRNYTYKEINKSLKTKISKSTLSYWFRNITNSTELKEKMRALSLKNLAAGREISLAKRKENRDKLIESLIAKNHHLRTLLFDKEIGKLALGLLYLAEGSKHRHGSLTFGNSDSGIIKLFLHLLRSVFNVDESKFRCTVQTRADCDIKKSEEFWLNITKIPKDQFYKTRIDPRTFGKISRNQDYKGVCRIDYFSGNIFLELQEIGKILCKGL